MGKYTPLIDHLRQSQTADVYLTFRRIEEIIGDTLPPSAYAHHAWWSNSLHPSHSWTTQWLAAGWVRDELDLKERAVSFRRAEIGNLLEPDSVEALEGYSRDFKLLSRTRNSRIADECRKRDDHTCVVCRFRLEDHGRFVIDVHHLDPLCVTDETVTKVDDLVCLCPNCHRIAHLRSPQPLGLEDIATVRARATG